MVRICEPIENCKVSAGTSFSQCDECVEGFYFKYHNSKEFGGVDKGRCIKSETNHDPFCYAFNEEESKC